MCFIEEHNPRALRMWGKGSEVGWKGSIWCFTRLAIMSQRQTHVKESISYVGWAGKGRTVNALWEEPAGSASMGALRGVRLILGVVERTSTSQVPSPPVPPLILQLTIQFLMNSVGIPALPIWKDCWKREKEYQCYRKARYYLLGHFLTLDQWRERRTWVGLCSTGRGTLMKAQGRASQGEHLVGAKHRGRRWYKADSASMAEGQIWLIVSFCNKVLLEQPLPFVHAVFMLQWQTWLVLIEMIWPTKLKMFTFWPFMNSWCERK